jgi:hypothetical protein
VAPGDRSSGQLIDGASIAISAATSNSFSSAGVPAPGDAVERLGEDGIVTVLDDHGRPGGRLEPPSYALAGCVLGETGLYIGFT